MAKKPRKKISLTTAVLFIAGLAIFSYPIVAQAYEAMHQSGIVQNYERETTVMPRKEKNAVQQAIDAENAKIKEKAKDTGNDADVIAAMTELNQKDSYENGDDNTLKKLVGSQLGSFRFQSWAGYVCRFSIASRIRQLVTGPV